MRLYLVLPLLFAAAYGWRILKPTVPNEQHVQSKIYHFVNRQDVQQQLHNPVHQQDFRDLLLLGKTYKCMQKPYIFAKNRMYGGQPHHDVPSKGN